MEKRKLTIVTDYYWPQKGGVEMVAQTLALNLRSDFDIQIVTHGVCSSPSLYHCFSDDKEIPLTDPNGNPIVCLKTRIMEKLLLLPLRIWDIPKLKKKRLYDLLYFFYRLTFKNKIIALLKDTRIVHCISTGYLARCISEICSEKNIKLICSPFIHFGKWGDSPGQINAYKSSDVLVCPTESFKTDFLTISRSAGGSVIVVIPPPISITSAPDPVNSERGEIFILFLGRREKHKGLSLLLSAYQGLESEGKLVIAGPGQKVDSGNSQITDLGEVDETMKQHLLCTCSLLCVPSKDESFGIVYIEAMSYGKPVVALNISPVNEIIENGKTGILVSPDDPVSLKKALKELLTNDSLRSEMGNAAKKDFDNRFSCDKVLQQYKKLY